MRTIRLPIMMQTTKHLYTGVRIALLAALLSLSLPSHAWWDLGHAVICEQALSAVSADIRTDIEGLLDGEEFGRACGWADRVRSKRPESSAWHYINLPPGMTDVRDEQHPAKDDLLIALDAQLAILADRQADSVQRAEALRWVGHLVGDLHQPMHVGYQSDRGGNKYRLTIDSALREAIGAPKLTSINMHTLWDGYLLIYATKRQHRSLSALTSELNTTATGAITDWANDSLALLNQPELRYASEHRLSALNLQYLEQNYPQALLRLRQAALNLAHLLETTLSHSPGR